MLVFLLVGNLYSQPVSVYIDKEETVSHVQYLHVAGDAPLNSTSCGSLLAASNKTLIIESVKTGIVIYKLTSQENFKIHQFDLARLQSFVVNLLIASKEKRNWYLAMPKAGLHWLISNLHWRSATQHQESKYAHIKNYPHTAYNIHIANCYVFSNKRLYNQQLSLQPTSSYKAKILNPLLTSFPPPIVT